VIIYGELESEARSSRNPIGRPGNQWKSSFLKSGPREVIRCGKVESDHRSSRNPIGRPGNQWKSSWWETCFTGVSRCGKHESGAQTPRKPIDRPGTNENRVRWKHVVWRYLDADKTNLRLNISKIHGSAINEWK
jgi:hypothetical protein